MQTAGHKRAIVVGAGIAGLAAAYYLRKHGVEVMVFERAQIVGGAIRSQWVHDRFLLEHGPNTFPSSAEPLLRLSRELSVDGQVVTSQISEKHRYILRRQGLARAPLGPKSMLTSSLISSSAKFRLLCEPLVKKKTEGDESVASFVRRRMGKELLDALVDPIVSGIYAGDAEQLSMASAFPRIVALEKEYGSLFKGLMKHKRKRIPQGLLSFRWGMGTIPARLEELLRREIQLETAIESVERMPDGQLFVRVEAPRRTFEADAVVLAAPAWVTARLLAKLLPQGIMPLMSIPYAPMTVVHTAFRRAAVAHPLKGFGFLVPRREGVRLLGSIWNSSLFPGRCPDGEVLLTNYIGGAMDPSAVELDDQEILEEVMAGLSTAVGVKEEPVFVSVKRLVHAIPQYTIGHAERLSEMERILSHAPGLFLTGNYFRGVAVSETIEYSRKVADKVLAYLGVRTPTG